MYIDGLAQGYGNFSALAMELSQSCSKPSIFNKYMLQGGVKVWYVCKHFVIHI